MVDQDPDQLGTFAPRVAAIANSNANVSPSQPASQPTPDQIAESIPRGYGIGQNAYTEAFANLAKQRGSLMNTIRAALAGGGAGAEASQNANNPFSAFMEGAAAGLQIPGQLALQKQAQIKSQLDASPLSVTMPALAAQYPTLSSIPTALAVQSIQKIAADSIDLYIAHNAKVGMPLDANGKPTNQIMNPAGEMALDDLPDMPTKADGTIDTTVAIPVELTSAAKLLNSVDVGHRTWTPQDIAGWNKSDLVKMVDSAKQQNANVFARGATLPDNVIAVAVSMIHNNDASIMDTMSPYQKIQVASAYGKLYPNDSLTNRIAAAKNIENPQVQQQLRTMQSIVGDPATGVNPDGTPTLADQLLAAHALLKNFDTTGLEAPIGGTLNWIKNKWQGLTQDQRLNSYNSLVNMFSQETGRAMTGGVPTDARVEQEKSTLGASLPDAAIQASVANTKRTMYQRMMDLSLMPTVQPGMNLPSNAFNPGAFNTMPPEGTIVPDRYGIQYIVRGGMFVKLTRPGASR